MYCGSSGRLGSLVMPLRLSVLTRVLVDDPLEGGAVAEAVVEGCGGDAVEGEEAVVGELGHVLGEAHFFDAPVEGGFGGLKLGEGVLGAGLRSGRGR